MQRMLTTPLTQYRANSYLVSELGAAVYKKVIFRYLRNFRSSELNDEAGDS